MNEIIPSQSLADCLHITMLIIHCSLPASSSSMLLGFCLPDWLRQPTTISVCLEKIFCPRRQRRWAVSGHCRALSDSPLHSPLLSSPPAKINSGNRKVPHQQISLTSPGLPLTGKFYVDTSPHQLPASLHSTTVSQPHNYNKKHGWSPTLQ